MFSSKKESRPERERLAMPCLTLVLHSKPCISSAAKELVAFPANRVADTSRIPITVCASTNHDTDLCSDWFPICHRIIKYPRIFGSQPLGLPFYFFSIANTLFKSFIISQPLLRLRQMELTHALFRHILPVPTPSSSHTLD